MGDHLDDELAALRARAYGPDADIHTDPAAAARLRQLEGEARRARDAVASPAPVSSFTAPGPPPPLPGVPSSPGAPPAVGAPASGGAPTSSGGPSAIPTATELPSDRRGPFDGPDSSPARSRRTPLLLACAVTAVAAAALTVPVTLWASSLADRPYAVLTASDDEPDEMFFSPDSSSVRFEDFLGIRVSVGELDYLEGERCMLIDPDPGGRGQDGSSTRGSCSPAGFGAVVDIPAADGYLSDDVRRELGDITALRFELVGDEVHVFVSRAENVSDPATEP